MSTVAENFLEELINLLTDEEFSNLSPEELMEEVTILIGDYKVDSSSSEQMVSTELSSLTEEDIKKADKSGVNQEIPSHINKDFILSKATQQYFNNIDLDEDTFNAMPVGQKLTHRAGINNIFNKLIQEELEKPIPKSTSNKKSSPFKRIEGVENSEEENKQVEKDYYEQRLNTLREDLKIVDRQIRDIKRQSKVDKISAFILERNSEELRTLEQQKFNTEKQIETYNTKLKSL